MPPSPSAVLALDIGTSSSRSAIHDASGRRLVPTTAQESYSLRTSADGRAELEPEAVRRAVFKIVAATLRQYPASAAPILGIGVSCFWHSMIGLDARGKAITPIYTWADGRCRADAAALRKGGKGTEARRHRRTGCMTRASFWTARLRWLKRTDPGLFRRVARWVSPAEWLQAEWCGGATVSLSMASGTGLLDAKTLRWNAPLLKQCGLTSAHLNPLSDAPGTLAPAVAKRFPRLGKAKWFPALGDGAASNLGSGATAPGVAAINVGTSAALRVVIDGDAKERASKTFSPAPFGLFGYRVDGTRRLVGGAVSNAGNLRAWALRELALPAEAALEKELAKRPLPVPGLVVLPFWVAERAPTWPEDLSSVVLGITQATTGTDLLQTLMEATYQRLALIADSVESVVRKAGTKKGRSLTFIVSGGISHSPAALQRLADVLGRPVRASVEPEASLRGAALFALERLGATPRPSKPGPLIRPRPAAARAHAAVRERQKELETLFQNPTP
ncbi:gluconokinase [Verrucomicrobium sp. GAS474]|uniref:gluconokinase n=1 Tax=Verrucomicrobium sp. GAS474 TaxID=1882831 RepID=UPI00087C2EF1|nr:gluconokinase [Verrucomicrobium sp. GAS474]SDT88444.1 gluconokinase [Verrucomicrobium sp. GAS474]